MKLQVHKEKAKQKKKIHVLAVGLRHQQDLALLQPLTAYFSSLSPFKVHHLRKSAGKHQQTKKDFKVKKCKSFTWLDSWAFTKLLRDFTECICVVCELHPPKVQRISPVVRNHTIKMRSALNAKIDSTWCAPHVHILH